MTDRLYRDAYDLELALDPRPRIAPGRVPATVRIARLPRDGNGVAAGAEVAVDRAGSSVGAPLPTDVRARFEASLGADLGGVRLHTGTDSADAAAAVGARAYTVGHDIHFAARQYAPSDPFGMHLLAHEVAHTVQQEGAAARPQFKLEVSSPGDALEVEADVAASQMVEGRPATVSSAGGLARQVMRKGPDDKDDPAAALVPLDKAIGETKKRYDAAAKAFADEQTKHPDLMSWQAPQGELDAVKGAGQPSDRDTPPGAANAPVLAYKTALANFRTSKDVKKLAQDLVNGARDQVKTKATDAKSKADALTLAQTNAALKDAQQKLDDLKGVFGATATTIINFVLGESAKLVTQWAMGDNMLLPMAGTKVAPMGANDKPASSVGTTGAEDTAAFGGQYGLTWGVQQAWSGIMSIVNSAEIAKVNEQIAALKAKIAALPSELDFLKQQASTAAQALVDAQALWGKLKADLEALQDDELKAAALVDQAANNAVFALKRETKGKGGAPQLNEHIDECKTLAASAKSADDTARDYQAALMAKREAVGALARADLAKVDLQTTTPDSPLAKDYQHWVQVGLETDKARGAPASTRERAQDVGARALQKKAALENQMLGTASGEPLPGAL